MQSYMACSIWAYSLGKTGPRTVFLLDYFPDKTEGQSMQVTSGAPTGFCNARYRADADDSVNIWRSETFAGAAAAAVGGQSIRHIN